MTRKHRAVHRIVWPIIALAVAFGFLSALVLRTPPAVETPAAQEMRK